MLNVSLTFYLIKVFFYFFAFRFTCYHSICNDHNIRHCHQTVGVLMYCVNIKNIQRHNASSQLSSSSFPNATSDDFHFFVSYFIMIK